MSHHKTSDPDWKGRLDKAKAGELDPTDWTEIEGETNDEGQAKLIHHLKSKKIYVRGRGGSRFIVPDKEAKQEIEKMKK